MNLLLVNFVTLLCIFYYVQGLYNKNVVCIFGESDQPVCRTFNSARRTEMKDKTIPSHDPYIPRNTTYLYNCTAAECVPLRLTTVAQLARTNLVLKSCFSEVTDVFVCERVRYHHMKNLDKLLFLSDHILNKTFYTVDCFVYADRGRVCQKNLDNADSHTKLVDTAAVARPNQPNILSQDEFICEETERREVNCDLNPYVPYIDGLKQRATVNATNDVLLSLGNYVVLLHYVCLGPWCGYTGRPTPTRRYERYDPPGGKIYRCYYAKKQQVCKKIYDKVNVIYHEREWYR